MAIEHISGEMGANHIQKTYLDAKIKSKDAAPPKAKDAVPQSDNVHISSDAIKLQEQQSLLNKIGEVLYQEPEIREDRVEQAMTRIHLAKYESNEVTDQIVNKIIEETETKQTELSGSRVGMDFDTIPDTDAVREDKLQEIQKRIQENYYEQQNVMDMIIKKLLT